MTHIQGFPLNGRVALVTGGAQGFGQAIATHLQALGCSVAVIDRRPGDWQKNLEERGFQAFNADITDREQIDAVFDTLNQQGLLVDTLVNNAGVFSNHLMPALVPAEYERIQRVNVVGQARCVEAFLRQQEIEASSLRCIVQIASVDSERSSAEGLVHYSVSKQTVWGLIRGLAESLRAYGIRCNAVCPGAAITEGALELVAAGAPQGIDVVAQWDGIVAKTPIGRLVTPEDVAYMVGFLASDASRAITGQLIPVDGGILCSPLEGYVPHSSTENTP